MADSRCYKNIGFDLAALPDGPSGTIIQSLGVRDKIRLQSVSKALRRALQHPQVRLSTVFLPTLLLHLLVTVSRPGGCRVLRRRRLCLVARYAGP